MRQQCSSRDKRGVLNGTDVDAFREQNRLPLSLLGLEGARKMNDTVKITMRGGTVRLTMSAKAAADSARCRRA